MNRKQFIGLLIFIVGISLLFFGIHAKNQVHEAKGVIEKTEHFFTQNPSTWNPIIEFFGGKAQEEASKYDAAVIAFLIAGSVLSLFGILIVFACRTKKTQN